MGEDQALRPEDINWAMIAHISAIAGFLIPLGQLLFPLIVWLSRRRQSGFIDYHGKESLNFQINLSLVIAAFLLAFWGINGFNSDQALSVLLDRLGIALFSYATFAVLFMIAVVRAASHTSKGIRYRYPFLLFRLWN